jgi:hypothetical protein
MAYATVLGVASRIPGVGLNAISTPDSGQVDTWIEQGASIIDRKLAGAGYATPVGSTALLYPELVALNELYAAAQVLRARALDSVTGAGEMRSDVWMREFWQSLNDMAKSDLTGAGVAQANVTGQKPRGMRTTQMRRVDGYSRTLYPTEVNE